jgi:hypothetical protein
MGRRRYGDSCVSEYQYYEFLAVDRPLEPAQIAELQALSPSARLDPTGLQTQELTADPGTLVEEHFDAFLHTSNSGRRLIFRVPLSQLSFEVAQQYCSTPVASARVHGEHVIIELNRLRAAGDADWDETDLGEGWLSTLVPARADLIAGDLRLLYLGWLLAADAGELDDDVLEPPVPSNLAALDDALRGVADFLDLDEDLLDIAAEASPVTARNTGELASWIAQLPVAEKNALLLRAAQGENAQLQAELQLAFRRYTGVPDRPEPVITAPRSVGELLGSMQQLQLD